MNERARVELLLPLVAMIDVLENGVREKVHPETLTVIADVKTAMNVVMEGVHGDENSKKVFRRVKRAHDMGLGRFAMEAARLDVYSYGLYYMLKVLVEEGTLSVGEDAFGTGLEGFLAALGKSDLDALDETRARSQGRMMLQTYQALGLYAGVRWPESFDG